MLKGLEAECRDSRCGSVPGESARARGWMVVCSHRDHSSCGSSPGGRLEATGLIREETPLVCTWRQGKTVGGARTLEGRWGLEETELPDLRGTWGTESPHIWPRLSLELLPQPRLLRPWPSPGIRGVNQRMEDLSLCLSNKMELLITTSLLEGCHLWQAIG